MTSITERSVTSDMLCDHLRILYGCTLCSSFSPEALENLQQRMIEEGLARTTINGRIVRVKRAFRWAARKGLVSPSVYPRSKGS